MKSEILNQTFEPTEQRKWIDRLFPNFTCDYPKPEPQMSGAISITTIVKVSWPDILRLIISRRCRIETKSLTTHEAEEVVTNSKFCVLPPERQ